jgi:Tfp pilus assembly protein PilV
MDLIYVLVAVLIFIGVLGLAGTRYANWSAGKIADRAITRIKTQARRR